MHLAKPGLGRLVRADHVMQEVSRLPTEEARALVQSLPADDLLLLSRRLHHSDALVLLELASTDQIERMVDLDCWTGDQLDLSKFLEWNASLLEVSQEKAASFLLEVDAEYPTVAVLKAGRVVDRRDVEEGDVPFDEDLEDAIPSPDNQFLVIVPKDDPVAGPLRTLIDYLYAGDLEHARTILQAARWEVSSVVEEDLLRFREARLEELGIPDADSAWRLMRPLSKEREEHLLTRSSLGGIGDRAERLTDALLVPFEKAADQVLEAAVEALTDDERLAFAQGVLHVARKLAVVRGDDVSDPSSLASAMQVLADHLRLALDVLCDRGDGVTWLRTVHPQYLFRIAQTRLIALRARARSILKPLGGDEAVPRFDSPWRDVLERLLQPLPELVRPGLVRVDTRAFRTVADLLEAEGLLSVIQNQARFFADLLASAPEAPSTVTFSRLLATGLANQVLGRGWSYAPLAVEDLPGLRGSLVVVSDGKALVKESIRGKILEDFESLIRAMYADAGQRHEVVRDLRSLAARTLDGLAGALGSGGRGAVERSGVAAEALLVEGEDEA